MQKKLFTLLCLTTIQASIQAMEPVTEGAVVAISKGSEKDGATATGFEMLRAASPEVDETLSIPRKVLNNAVFGYTGFQKQLSDAMGAAINSASKQWDPESYVLNPKNTQLYSKFMEKTEAATNLEDLTALLHDEELGGDALKRITARACAGQNLLAQMTRDMLNGKLATDSAGLTKIGQIFEATALAQKSLPSFYCKFTELAVQKNQQAAATAQRGVDMLPK